MKNKIDPYNPSGSVVEEAHQVSKQIKKDCLRLLTRRDHSRKEIQHKMAVKGYESSQVSAVIDDLAQQSWQDDSRYAESYARMRSHKGFGPVRIAYELKQQGIETHTVDKVLQATSDNWLNLMEQVYNKKYPESLAMDINERAKRIRFLLQRGFSSAMITTLFK
jgi:regulatory protein